MALSVGTVGRTLAALLAALAAFAVVALAVTAALDPYVWPSALVGLPAGAVVGTVAFLLVRRLVRSDGDG